METDTARLEARARSNANLRPFQKGQCGNPKGRGVKKRREPQNVIEAAFKEVEVIIVEDIREAARKLTGKAIRKLDKLLERDDQPKTQLGAVKEVFDRVWGKPKEHVQTDVKLDLEWLLNRGRELAEQREREQARLLIEGGEDPP
jgi:hypothetical protein